MIVNTPKFKRGDVVWIGHRGADLRTPHFIEQCEVLTVREFRGQLHFAYALSGGAVRSESDIFARREDAMVWLTT